MNGYSVKIKESSKELTAKERIKLKDTTTAVKIGEVEGVFITPKAWVVLDVHNEKSDDVDYLQYLILDEDGTTYVTGSETFWTSFYDIFTEMENEKEPYQVTPIKRKSKNFAGNFITCSIV